MDQIGQAATLQSIDPILTSSPTANLAQFGWGLALIHKGHILGKVYHFFMQFDLKQGENCIYNIALRYIRGTGKRNSKKTSIARDLELQIEGIKG